MCAYLGTIKGEKLNEPESDPSPICQKKKCPEPGPKGLSVSGPGGLAGPSVSWQPHAKQTNKQKTAASPFNHHLNCNTIIYSRYKQKHSVLLYGELNFACYLQRLKVRLQEWEWLDEGKDIKVSQSEADWGGSIPLPTWDATGAVAIAMKIESYVLATLVCYPLQKCSSVWTLTFFSHISKLKWRQR